MTNLYLKFSRGQVVYTILIFFVVFLVISTESQVTVGITIEPTSEMPTLLPSRPTRKPTMIPSRRPASNRPTSSPSTRRPSTLIPSSASPTFSPNDLAKRGFLFISGDDADHHSTSFKINNLDRVMIKVIVECLVSSGISSATTDVLVLGMLFTGIDATSTLGNGGSCKGRSQTWFAFTKWMRNAGNPTYRIVNTAEELRQVDFYDYKMIYMPSQKSTAQCQNFTFTLCPLEDVLYERRGEIMDWVNYHHGSIFALEQSRSPIKILSSTGGTIVLDYGCKNAFAWFPLELQFITREVTNVRGTPEFYGDIENVKDVDISHMSYHVGFTGPPGFAGLRPLIYDPLAPQFTYALGGSAVFLVNTSSPSARPTSAAPIMPTKMPTFTPSAPSSLPSYCPTCSPSMHPTGIPSSQPSPNPSAHPSTPTPTIMPNTLPFARPSSAPSANPSSSQPSERPTGMPTAQPTSYPSSQPTMFFQDMIPTETFPIALPTPDPISTPSAHPIAVPSSVPIVSPSSVPRSPSRQPTNMLLTTQPSNAVSKSVSLAPKSTFVPSSISTVILFAAPTFIATSKPVANPSVSPSSSSVKTLLPSMNILRSTGHPSAPPTNAMSRVSSVESPVDCNKPIPICRGTCSVSTFSFQQIITSMTPTIFLRDTKTFACVVSQYAGISAKSVYVSAPVRYNSLLSSMQLNADSVIVPYTISFIVEPYGYKTSYDAFRSINNSLHNAIYNGEFSTLLNMLSAIPVYSPYYNYPVASTSITVYISVTSPPTLSPSFGRNGYSADSSSQMVVDSGSEMIIIIVVVIIVGFCIIAGLYIFIKRRFKNSLKKKEILEITNANPDGEYVPNGDGELFEPGSDLGYQRRNYYRI